MELAAFGVPFFGKEMKAENDAFTSVPRLHPQTDPLPWMLHQPPSHLSTHTPLPTC